MNPFEDVQVQPIYGGFRCLVTWKVAEEFGGSSFLALKSPDGIHNWTPISPVTTESFAVDEHLISQGKLIEFYYKVEFKAGNQTYTSPKVGTFGTISKEEFGAARRIMEIEYQALRPFTKVKLFKLRVHGKPCPRCVDDDTGQAIGTSQCEICWGTLKECGYWPPVPTHMRLMTTSPTVQLDSRDGTGSVDPIEHKARMLAFPQLRKEDLIVHKEADRRYLVNEVEYTYLGGKIPVVALPNLKLLRTVDIRYKIPV